MFCPLRHSQGLRTNPIALWHTQWPGANRRKSLAQVSRFSACAIVAGQLPEAASGREEE
ncbi:hypothetical protein PSEUDO8O_170190 [Pseudomonas sp. 8O]|nr:hypothetical protein PSEUDO8O_170190 [Pseudomonas sp. 8O]